jgi:catechol 2,3-dioxygenase-like lactoylglutathione lyase family enzyme
MGMTNKAASILRLLLSCLLAAGLVGADAGVALQSAPPSASPSPSPASAYDGITIRRPTLMVRDMDRALALYRDILGLRLGRLSQDGSDSYVYTAFNIPEGTVVWHATFDTDKEQRVLSLLAVKSMPEPRELKGLRTTAILVNANGRLADIRERLIAGGYLVLPNHSLAPNGTEFAFEDADGHLIAVYEFGSR